MQRSLEQRMAIKFCVEKSAAETIPMLKKAFGIDCLSDRQIFRWHKAFAEGREDVNDENRARRPSTSSSDDNVKRSGEEVYEIFNTKYPDRRISQSTIFIPKSGRKRILDDEQKLDILLDIQDNLHKPTIQVAADNDIFCVYFGKPHSLRRCVAATLSNWMARSEDSNTPPDDLFKTTNSNC
ncbi:hypothetical protein NQ318_012238 [Aromia moschata]|uniref:Mos1 transposase HTH domain-containing protein n=1 Tax=Aromia moschata TaxID=1265417 RepID=A0AAV8YLI7_9CUCU|nr:hypothetical protein NQ318_012238 [Aromia moschata]